MRLADRLMHRINSNRMMSGYHGRLPVIVNIDNVIQYFYEDLADKVMDETGEGFPNIAPPFEWAIYQGRRPQVKNENYRYSINEITETCVVVQAIDIQGKDADYLLRQILKMKNVSGDVETGINANLLKKAKWMEIVTLFVANDKDHHSMCMPRCFWFVFIDDAGKYITVTNDGSTLLLFPDWQSKIIDDLGGSVADFISDMRGFTDPVFLAISLMHCKNTTLMDVHPDKALAKRTIQRHGIPLNSYKVIDIKPMAKVLRDVNDGNGDTSFKHRLHICRGHFKDYRAHGLFGKVNGMFWWGQHVRGSKEHGVIEKEYAVSR